MMADPSGLILNKRELAGMFGTSEPTVAGWVREGCPVLRGGSHGVAYEFDAVAVKAWRDGVEAKAAKDREEKLRQYDELQASLFGEDDLPKIDGAAGLSPDARAKWFRSELDRMRLAKDRGELVTAADLGVTIAVVLTELRNRVRGLPDQLVRTAGLTDAQAAAIETGIDDALNDMVTALQARLKLDGADRAAA